MTSVWPALWPPWKRTTMSACSESQSTIFPLPSSPHWEPTTTTLAIKCPSAQPEIIANPQGLAQAPTLPELTEAAASGKAAERGQARPSWTGDGGCPTAHPWLGYVSKPDKSAH